MTVTGHAADEALISEARHFVYQHFAETTHPPSVEQTARHFDISLDLARQIFDELHARHALVLDPQTRHILIANPFSGIPTDYRVHIANKSYFANCAWDMLGMPTARFTLTLSSKRHAPKVKSKCSWRSRKAKWLLPT